MVCSSSAAHDHRRVANIAGTLGRPSAVVGTPLTGRLRVGSRVLLCSTACNAPYQNSVRVLEKS